MLSWHHLAVLLIPGLGLWACGCRHGAAAVAIVFTAVALLGLCLGWGCLAAAWIAAHLVAYAFTDR